MWDFLKQLMDPNSILHYGGIALLLIVIFAENGLIIGFFLPGDSLIFLSGLVCATKPEILGVGIVELSLLMYTAAVLGCLFGYGFGWRIGPKAFNRKESWLYKKKYVDMTQDFYNKHGGKTLVLGRFLPIIRTFAPILAGVIHVRFGVFMFYNLLGGALWVGILSFAGYFLGDRFPIIQNYLGYIIIGFITITSLILLNTYLIQRRRKKKQDLKSENE